MQEIVELIISSIISIITAIIFAKIVTNQNYSNKNRKIIVFFVTVILFALNSKYSYENIKTIINFLVHIYFFHNYFKLSLSKSIFITFVYAIILMIPDMLQLFFVVNVLKMSKEYCYNIVAGGLISNLIICIFMIIITFLLKDKLKKLFESNIENNYNVLTLSVFTLFCVIILFFDIITNYKTNNNISSYILLIVIFLVVIANLIKEKIEVNDRIQEYNGLLGFMKSYEKEIEENKIQNHEIKNQFITVQSMVRDNTPKSKIIRYLDNIIKEKSNIDDSRYTDLQYLPLNGIKGFICNKLNKAVEQNLNVSVVIEKGVETSIISNLSTRDFKKLGILLGVYLDNAIEASSLSKEKYLGLEIYLNKKGVIIIITNTFENFIRTSEDNKTISTKGKGRGHGLLLVNKVLSESKLFSVQSEIIKKVYIQKILVKKIK